MKRRRPCLRSSLAALVCHDSRRRASLTRLASIASLGGPLLPGKPDGAGAGPARSEPPPLAAPTFTAPITTTATAKKAPTKARPNIRSPTTRRFPITPGLRPEHRATLRRPGSSTSKISLTRSGDRRARARPLCLPGLPPPRLRAWAVGKAASPTVLRPKPADSHRPHVDSPCGPPPYRLVAA